MADTTEDNDTATSEAFAVARIAELVGDGDGTTPPPREVEAGHQGIRIEPLDTASGKSSAAAPPVRSVREQAGQEVHDVSMFLEDIEARRSAGTAVPAPRPVRTVLGSFTQSPIAQTRIQVLAAAATARHLEGERSANAQRLLALARDNAARLQALRDQERRATALTHQENGTAQQEITDSDHQRAEREMAEDRQIFNAAAAVALGYVAAKGLPAYDQLAEHSETQLGPVPPAEPGTGPATVGGGPSKIDHTKSALDSIGRGLAQSVGPVVGDDEVAPHLSPVNLTQVHEELASIAASVLPGIKAAMSGHPRTIKELLNVEQRPDEESDVAFEQESELTRDLETARGPLAGP